MRKNKTDFIPVCIFIVVFGFLFLTGEPTYAGDTFQHENQMIMREPGYALLIQLLRFLSPQKYYWLLIADCGFIHQKRRIDRICSENITAHGMDHNIYCLFVPQAV